MARLQTAAPLIGMMMASANRTEGESQLASATVPSVVTDRTRTGSLPVFKTTAVNSYMNISGAPLTYTLGRSYWCRGYFQVDSLPAGATLGEIISYNNGTNNQAKVSFDSSGQIVVTDNAVAVVGTSGVIGADTWVMVELRVKLNAVPTTSNGEIELWVNGVQVFNLTGQNCGTANLVQMRIGWQNGAGLGAVWFTDVAVNDDQGADQNGRPGPGTVRHLLPVADLSIGNWLAGAAGTTNLFDAVDNQPPVGVAVASATVTSQIKNIVSGSSSYECEVQDYDTAGVPSSETIKLVQAVSRVSVDNLTATNTGTQRVYSNPDQGSDSAVNFEIGGLIAVADGTVPCGWRTEKGAYVYNPSVTRATRPRLRLTKTTAATRAHMADYMAVLVESAPAPKSLVFPGGGHNDYRRHFLSRR